MGHEVRRVRVTADKIGMWQLNSMCVPFWVLQLTDTINIIGRVGEIRMGFLAMVIQEFFTLFNYSLFEIISKLKVKKSSVGCLGGSVGSASDP